MNTNVPAFLTMTYLENHFFNNITHPNSYMCTLIWHKVLNYICVNNHRQVLTKCEPLILSTVTENDEIRWEWNGPIDLDVVTKKLNKLVKKKSKKDISMSFIDYMLIYQRNIHMIQMIN